MTSPADPPQEPDAPDAATAPDDATTPAPAPDPPRRRWSLRRQPPAEAAAASNGAGEDEGQTEVIPPPPRAEGAGRLRRRRKKLLTEREEAVYHLGGLAFELYRRDQLTPEVMRLRAGEVALLDDTVRDIDARLGEIDRERRERRRPAAAAGAAGNCLTCRAPFRAEARFCWQCGTQLVPSSPGDEQPTAAIPPIRDDG
jgi:hypothetical protein